MSKFRRGQLVSGFQTCRPWMESAVGSPCTRYLGSVFFFFFFTRDMLQTLEPCTPLWGPPHSTGQPAKAGMEIDGKEF